MLNLSFWCLMMVEWLFLAVPWGCLRFVNVVFPDHTNLLLWFGLLLYVPVKDMVISVRSFHLTTLVTWASG